ncbi:hypothetical protein CROQUDRAFT_687234, partial [Cronartium quercuum f. sp. fusiforme G11]
KTRWDESHIEPDIKEGDLVCVSRVHFRNISSNPKFRDFFIGPFLVLRLVGMNAVEVDPHGPFSRRHPVFPVSLMEIYGKK